MWEDLFAGYSVNYPRQKNSDTKKDIPGSRSLDDVFFIILYYSTEEMWNNFDDQVYKLVERYVSKKFLEINTVLLETEKF